MTSLCFSYKNDSKERGVRSKRGHAMQSFKQTQSHNPPTKKHFGTNNLVIFHENKKTSPTTDKNFNFNWNIWLLKIKEIRSLSNYLLFLNQVYLNSCGPHFHLQNRIVGVDPSKDLSILEEKYAISLIYINKNGIITQGPCLLRGVY